MSSIETKNNSMLVPDLRFSSPEHVLQEIEDMNVKGGSPFGRAAAWMYKLAVEQETFADTGALRARLEGLAARIAGLKPTMGTVFNTQMLVFDLLDAAGDAPVGTVQERVGQLCDRLIAASYEAVGAVGEIGGAFIHDGDVVMMHSYTSTLMGIFQNAAALGRKFKVISTESRPLRESRHVVRGLQRLGIPVLYITDASIWEFMPQADYILMGADSLTWTGDVANKMGSAMIAQLALACKKPVYFATELFKLDTRTRCGYRVVLERRTPDEIVSPEDFESLEGIEVVNQFFDLTPAAHIRGLITEFGVIAPSAGSTLWDRLHDSLLLPG